MKRDVVITSASGYTFDQIRYWLNSLDSSGFTGERVIVVGNASRQLVTRLEARGCHVVSRETLLGIHHDTERSPFVDEHMSVDRYFLFWKFLASRSSDEIRYVISVDIRDAVFQLDPTVWLAEHLGEKQLVVASEGLTYEDQPWNRQSMTDAFGTQVFDYMRGCLVWNCGTIAGDLSLFRDMALNLYLGCAARNVSYADQASLNILLSLSPYRQLTLFDSGDLGWACQTVTMVAAARGPELSYKFRGAEPLFDGDVAYTRAGKPFCIVHQYDRIPHWKMCLEKKFG
jgi:hypothetical protein